MLSRSIFDRLVTAIPDTYHAIGNPLKHTLPSPSDSQQPANYTPSSSFSDSTRILEAKDFPKVRFWDIGSYKREHDEEAERAHIRSNGAIHKVYYFLQDKDGNHVTGSQARGINSAVRKVYNTWYAEDKLVPKFSSVSATLLKQLLTEVSIHWPQVVLCEGNWKISRIGSATYSGYFKDLVKHGYITKLGKRVGDVASDTHISGEQKKRATTAVPDGPKRLSKKPKIACVLHYSNSYFY